MGRALHVNNRKQTTETRKTIFLAMVTANGVVKNENTVGLVDNEVTLADLFAP